MRRTHIRQSSWARPQTIPAPLARAGPRREWRRAPALSPPSCLGPPVDDALRLAERPLAPTRRDNAHFRRYANMRLHRMRERAGGVGARDLRKRRRSRLDLNLELVQAAVPAQN